MANELEWLRSKATALPVELMVVTPDEAVAAECEAGTYRIVRLHFKGTIPYRMAMALRGCKDLIKTDAETETLRLGTGYRGGEGACEYFRTTYTLVEAA